MATHVEGLLYQDFYFCDGENCSDGGGREMVVEDIGMIVGWTL